MIAEIKNTQVIIMLKQIFLSTILIVGLIASSAVAQNMDSRAGDEAALEALYESTNGDTWIDNTGWNSSGMSLSGDIYGVETSTIDGELRVVSVKLNGTIGWETQYEVGVEGELGGNGLTGTLPIELGNLKECLYFNVKQNEISGSLPPELANMKEVRHLLLNGRTFDPQPQNKKHHQGKPWTSDERSNLFSGSIPPEFGNFPNIEILEMEGEINSQYQDNDDEDILTGSIPSELGNLSTLRGIWLDWNGLTGGIPDNLRNLSNIQQFNVSRNFLDGSISEFISEWNDLIWTNFNWNAFTGPIPDFSNMPNLRSLQIRQNELSGNVDWLSSVNWNDMLTLQLGFNEEFTGNLPEFDGYLGGITVEFIGNNFTGSIHDNITEFWRVKILTFGWNPNLGGTLPQTGWDNFSNQLRQIRFNTTQITGNISGEMLRAFDNSDLQNAYFNNANFTSANIDAIDNMQYGEVHLSGNRLTFKDFVLPDGVIPSNIASYDNQKPFGTERTRSVVTGGSITLDDFDSDLSHPDNSYQWQLNGVAISGATSKNLTLNSISLDDAGTYTLKVTNSNVSGMTLTSRGIELSVTENGGGTSPNTPTLSSPQNGADSQPTTLTLDWASVSDADNYHLEVSAESSFNTYDFNKNNLNSSSQEIADLNEGEEYYWRVRASNEYGDSNWSQTWSFTTETSSGGSVPEMPSLSSPQDGASDQPTTLILDWDSVNGADDYHLQVSTQNDFSTFSFNQGNLSTTEREISGLDESEEYYWRVQASNETGNSTWSEIWSFTTENSGTTGLVAPNQISPSDASEDLSVTPEFNWSSVDGADSYILHVSGTSPSEMVIEETIDGTTFTPNSNLDTARTHHWRVRAVQDGVNGEWSSIWEFTTLSSGGGSDASGSSTISYNEGWNLVSLPREASNKQFENIFTDIAPSSIYSFEGTYTPDSELDPGKGYWIKLLSSQEVTFDGESISTLNLPLKEGWNLIGGPDSSIDVASEISDPENIIEKICKPSGEVNSNCENVASLEPGKAYFMKVSDSGNISLN